MNFLFWIILFLSLAFNFALFKTAKDLKAKYIEVLKNERNASNDTVINATE